MKNTGMWICRIILGLVGIILLVQGFMWSFLPESNLAINDIVANSTLGLNMIKSDIGGPLMAGGLMLILYAIKWKEFYLPLMIFVSGYLIVRIVSFFADGSHPTIIMGIILEAVVLVLIVVLNNLRKKAS
ncbi:DUF4345 family protein [Aureispira anguillae]|uniref:DUF4345 domain-containing protein n=1 Tax=Aureispira anguillae TaxID=2864201 RepID=A0A916DTH3_9BACT|nr:hypothetical protein [Aureispira anguillae]BDS11486.1 hypothetical protein AsAng_0022000 [Aureispira anguillae]